MDRHKEKVESGADERMLGAEEEPGGGGELAGVEVDVEKHWEVGLDGEGWCRQWGSSMSAGGEERGLL